MKNRLQEWKIIIVSAIMFFLPDIAFAFSELPTDALPEVTDSSSVASRFIHRIEAEARPGYIIPTNTFFQGENYFQQPIRNSFSTHLRYSFQFSPNTITDRIYGGVYQGIGLASYRFQDKKELGEPIALYLFQGARIARLNSRATFNYEWNFGVSTGWNPYDSEDNPYNKVIGSKVNAYININFYLNWMLSNQLDLTTGVDLTHFSNGNTKFPNAGLNAAGLKVGLVYNFNRKQNTLPKPLVQSQIPYFPRHISYDLVLFGSWRRKGVVVGDEQVASPYAYTVLGFNFAPMYNLGYKFRVGVSLDGVYDCSANVYAPDYILGTTPDICKPSFDKQLALGLSGRAEYVMPYFTVGLGLGANVLHAGDDLKSIYQILALKIKVTRNSFIHIGYSLQDFHTPSFLMLGVGFRFNNKYPNL